MDRDDIESEFAKTEALLLTCFKTLISEEDSIAGKVALVIDEAMDKLLALDKAVCDFLIKNEKQIA
jgi:hypothetical protein